MLLSTTGPGVQYAAYPDLTETNPKAKRKAYHLQMARAFWSHYHNSGSRDFRNGRMSGRYKLAEDYANGVNKVKTVLKDDDGHRDISGSKADLYRPLKILKKSLRAVDGLMKDREFTATVTPIDATAQDEKHAYAAATRAQMEHGQWLQSLGMQMQGGAPQGEVPVDEDEFDLHMELKYRHRDAMLLELKLALALYLSEYDQQNRQCLRDETTYGSSVLYLALRGPRRLPVRLDPGACLFLPSSTENYANLQQGGHVEKVSLAQVLKEIDADPDTTLTADEREQLIALARQNMPGAGGGNRNFYYDDALGGQPEMAGQLEVFRFSYKSQDAVVMKEGVNKFGNKQVREKPANYSGKTDERGTVHRRTVSSWYEASLILNTEIGYGCRKAYEQLRDEDNPFDCHPLYVVTSPDMLGGYTESVVEQCMTLVDTACEAFSRLRFKLATMIGSWMEFDLDAIENAALKKADGTTTSPHETIENFFKNGYILGRKSSGGESGGEKIGRIIDSGELPFANEIAEQWNTIERCAQQIEAITGINGSISADDPASRQGANVTQMAIAGAENTLQYLYNAKQTRFERVIRALAVSIKQSEPRQPLTGAVPTAKGIEIVGVSDTLADRVMTCRVERKPTAEEWKRLYDQVSIMLTQQLIEPEDALFVQAIDNLKQAGAMLAVRAKRKRRNAQQDAQSQTSMASQQQQESAKVTGEEARKTNDQLHQQAMELQALKNEGAVLAAKAQVEGQAGITEMMNAMKLMHQENQLSHQAQQADQQRETELAKHDAQLSSQEEQAELQRQHDAEQNAAALAAKPTPAKK